MSYGLLSADASNRQRKNQSPGSNHHRISGIVDAIRWAERILEEIDKRWPAQDREKSA
jgi:hypothetical protein